MKTGIILTCVILLAVGRIYTTNAAKRQKSLSNIDNHFNSNKEKLCPDLEAITPCSCDTSHSGVTMDCSKVTTELELQSIFAKPFPQNDMYSFLMYQPEIHSSIDELPLGVFGSKTFEKVNFSHVTFNFSFNSFSHMNATLRQFLVNSVPIYKINYSFNAYAVLNSISFKRCPLTDFLISSPTLEVLNLRFTDITERADNNPYLFGVMPNLTELIVTYGNLHKMPDTSGYPKLERFVTSKNSILSIDVSQRTENYLDYFSASSNDFQDIPVDSIRMSENSSFFMHRNQIRYLEEEKWRNIFLNASSILLGSNPLDCSCNMAWLFGNDTKGTPFIEKMPGTERCDDGVLLTDLDPSDYDTC